jgi:enoyl-CoA hydratase
MAVHLRVQDDVAVITLDAPPLNVLTLGLLADLDAALDRAGEARSVLLESAIGGVFSAGADLKLAAAGTVAEFAAYLDTLNRVVDRLAFWPAPTVAAIEGRALGGGLELALACDLRVVGATAAVGLPEIRLGLMPGAGGLHRLATWTPRPVVLDLLLTGRELVGEDIVRAGLAQYLEADPHDAATALATRLAAGSPGAMRGIKAAVRQAADTPAMAAVIEREQVLELFGSPHGREGVAAFLGRRAPVFR